MWSCWAWGQRNRQLTPGGSADCISQLPSMLGAMRALHRVSIGHDAAHPPTLPVELVHLCVWGRCQHSHASIVTSTCVKMLLLSQGCALQMLRCSKSLCAAFEAWERLWDLPAVWSGFTEISQAAGGKQVLVDQAPAKVTSDLHFPWGILLWWWQAKGCRPLGSALPLHVPSA